MNKYTQLIDNYLAGQMSLTERQEFELLLTQDAKLRAAFALQQQVLQGIERAGIRAELSKGLKKGAFRSKARKWFTAVLITGLIAAAVLAVKNNKISAPESDNIRYELNEANAKAWSDADKYLSPEIFMIDPAHDTVIETKGGIICSIPAYAFIDGSGKEAEGPVELEMKEALTPLAIMKAVLSTTSDGKLLETGGMFYINARQDGNNLSIAKDKGIYTSIPNLNPGKAMQLFEGQRSAESGQINWVSPKPFENKLHPVDILSLNFYPPHFLDSLRQFGFDVKNKKLTDSIYYSFVCGAAPQVQTGYADERGGMRIRSDSTSAAGYSSQRGEQLFRQNCAACHNTNSQKLTGPGLAGMIERAPQPAIPWLTRFILNSEKMIHSGDAYANKIYRESGRGAMTVFEGQLSEGDVHAIIDYINASAYSAAKSPCEIDPSRIRAIWNKKFDNTILATKEFEERLQAIFKTCNHQVLDLYMNHLDKPMYEIDSMAAELLHEKEWEALGPFTTFYTRHDGAVEIKQSHMKKLQQYMAEKQKIYHDAALKTINAYYEKEWKAGAVAMEKINSSGEKESQRISITLHEELEINMDEAYRQLGKQRPPKVPFAGGYLGTSIVTMGWKNVDQYVLEATLNRTTLDYTDPGTGKRAVIRYAPFEVSVSHFKDFDRVTAYLIPDRLSSFQRIGNAGNIFKENLNELLKYSAMVIGFKGEAVYGVKIAEAKPGKNTVTLLKMSARDLKNLQVLNPQAVPDLLADLKYQVLEEKEQRRQQAYLRREQVRAKLQQVVFPCSEPVVADETLYER